MKMLDDERIAKAIAQVKEQGGHVFMVLGVPNMEQRKIVGWVAGVLHDWYDPSDPDWAQEAVYDLPYAMGGGYTVVEFLDPSDFTVGKDDEDGMLQTFYKGEGFDFPPDVDWEPTGVIVTFGYSDSMTNIWTTCVYVNREGKYAIGMM